MKALYPIELVVWGINNCPVNPLQPLKAWLPIFSKDNPKFIPVNPLHPLKASSSILINWVGNIKFPVKLVLLANADLAIISVSLSIFNDPVGLVAPIDPKHHL